MRIVPLFDGDAQALEFAMKDLQAARDDVGQMGVRATRGLGAGHAAQAVNDARDALDAVARPVQHAGQVRLDVGEVDLFSHPIDWVEARSGGYFGLSR